ncbi:GNAT family N-acetyltransferase [Clostridium chromiireducens]|uniref:GNAT family N-acetyltransferase n=1 Tax=Clostridium chromiireducens TaxID=225345 RepID=A0A399IRV4_9CLOT|nr:GNAT family N-acetyltransferase [Clostridium chromiireducens]RII35745.1 GNAT family N-acetyltransferase [Clostridium chromiireducens]
MKIISKNPNGPDALSLMDELSNELEYITGNSGKSSFNLNDVCVPRSLFVVAYDENEEPVGCGAIRPINENIAEVKRMYAKTRGLGVGTEILHHLEIQAKELGYSALWLETRLINKQAVLFYEKNGYHRIANYGKYIDNFEAICFEKNII